MISALFLVSLVFLPWWVSVPLGIIAATTKYGGPIAVFGGVVLDAVYGTPIDILFGFQYVYTTLFLLVVLLVYVLSDVGAD